MGLSPEWLTRAGYVVTADGRAVKATGATPPDSRFDPRRVPPPTPGFVQMRPEDRLQADAIRRFSPRLVDGACLMPLNGEMPGGRGGQERRFKNAQIKRRAMGYRRGFPDLQAVRPGLTGFLELKRGAGEEPDLYGHKTAAGALSKEQRGFRDWCLEHGHQWAKTDTLELIEAKLLEWEVIL